MGIFDRFNKNNVKNKNNNNSNNSKNNNRKFSRNNNISEDNTYLDRDNIANNIDNDNEIESYNYNNEDGNLKQSYFNKAKSKFINLSENSDGTDYGDNDKKYREDENDDTNSNHFNNDDLKNEADELFDYSTQAEIIRPKSLEERYKEDFIESKTQLNKSVKAIAAVILTMFVGLISYFIYFQIVKAPDLKLHGGNTRTIDARNKVFRGSILDSKGNVLSESKLDGDGHQSRIYHGGEAYSNILGYVSDRYSVTGLEASLDSTLSKSFDIKSMLTLDFVKNIFDGDFDFNAKPKGHTVKLTLDSNIQKYAYSLLNGKKGSVVAINPKSGEIIAMVSSPGFNPSELQNVMEKVNNDKDYASLGPLVNKAINNYYAPGSTFKAVTLASAIANIPGVSDKTFDDNGAIKFDDGTSLPNLDGHVYGKVTLQEAFTMSSNVVFGGLALTLSNAQLKDTAEDFGFNRQLNSKGLYPIVSVFPTHNKSQVGLMAQSGIGQGEVLASPLQMAMVASAIANNGVLMQPQLVSQVIDKNGYIMDELEAKVYSTPMNSEVSSKVKKFLETNVSSGSGTYSSLASIEGAGKTGTAEFQTQKGFRINSWFIGFAPASDPKIAIAVLVEDLENTNDNLSARNATPMAAQIMEEYLNEN